MTIIDTTSQDNHEMLDRNLVLLVFSSTWCEPCKRIITELEKIDSEISSTIKIVVKDLYENQEIAKKFDIIGTPTLILLKDGEILGKLIGYQSKKVITDFIRKYI